MNHPTDSELDQYLREELPDTRLAQIDDHIDAESCGPCRERLEHKVRAIVDRLPGSFSGELRGAINGPGIPSLPQPVTKDDVFPGFVILNKVGQGGMGVVYKARELDPPRVVAIKTILGKRGREEEDRLQEEIKALAILEHRHIVRIYTTGQSAIGVTFFAMEHVDGRSLLHLVERGPQLATDVARMAQVLASTIQFAHDRGIIHRDLKPANILQRRVNGELVVTDFGLVKWVKGGVDLTKSLSIVGTPLYMAPEQVTGLAKVTEQTDIYAIGVIVYEMVTGRPPFQGVNEHDVLERIKNEEPVPPSGLVKIPRDLETICLKCLHKVPSRRYATAQELADDLGRFLAREPIRARRAGSGERLVKWVQRNPVKAMGLTSLLVILIGFISILTGSVWILRTEQAKTEYERDIAQRQRYVTDMNLAQSAWRDGDISRMLSLLSRHRPKQLGDPDYRGWEWSYFMGLTRKEALSLHGPGQQIHSLAFSPDGKRLAASGSEAHVSLSPPLALFRNEVTTWDSATGRVLTTFSTGDNFGREATTIRFSPDGSRIAAKLPGCIEIWDAVAGNRERSLSECYYGLAFSPDHAWIASCSPSLGGQREHSVVIRDYEKGQSVGTLSWIDAPGMAPGFADYTVDLAFRPDGKALALVAKSVLVVWDLDGAKAARSPQMLPHRASRLVYSPDGKRLATTDGSTVTIWDSTASPMIRMNRLAVENADLAFSPDGTRLATAGPGSIVALWDIETGRQMASFRGHQSQVRRVSVDPDGRLASCNPSWSEDSPGSVKVWDAASTQEGTRIPGAKILGVFSPDGQTQTLMTMGFDGLMTVDPSSGKVMGTMKRLRLQHEEIYTVPAISPDMSLVASGANKNGPIHVYDAKTGQKIRDLSRGLGMWMNYVTISPDSRYLAAVFEPDSPGQPVPKTLRRVKIWDMLEGREVHALDGIGVAEFSPDGKRVATGRPEGGATIWNLGSSSPLILKDPAAVGSLAFSWDGRYLATSNDFNERIRKKPAVITLWDCATGQRLRTLSGHSDKVTRLAFNPARMNRLASISKDRSVKLWDIDLGAETLTLRVHGNRATGLAFSSDGSYLAASSHDEFAEDFESSEVVIWAASTVGKIAGDALRPSAVGR